MLFFKILKEKTGVATKRPRGIHEHLKAGADWLLRAQSASDDDGVSAWYDLKQRAWRASYPETTGYIIPTLYDYASLSGEPIYAEKATEMAWWESMIQLQDGGVRAGTMDADLVAPTIFNTGQVLLGWERAWRETGEERFKISLEQGADWLVSAQDEDGAWRKFPSPFAAHKINSYNTRVAYGLIRAYSVLEDVRYLEAALKNIQFVINQGHSNGWLPNNCLNDNDNPLTHTIAYSIRGIFEVGVAAKEDRFVDFAFKMATAVAGARRADGALPGRLDNQWKGMVPWSCITGNAQMAIIWLKMAAYLGKSDLATIAREINSFNMSIHELEDADSDIRGGVRGSFPSNGGYMTWRYPNWAAKFFIDALMLQLQMEKT